MLAKSHLSKLQNYCTPTGRNQCNQLCCPVNFFVTQQATGVLLYKYWYFYSFWQNRILLTMIYFSNVAWAVLISILLASVLFSLNSLSSNLGEECLEPGVLVEIKLMLDSTFEYCIMDRSNYECQKLRNPSQILEYCNTIK